MFVNDTTYIKADPETSTSSAVDLVITDLADSEVALLERIASLEADVAIYRELAVQAIHSLHDLVQERDRQRERYARLLEEFKSFRRRVMTEALAA